MTWDRSKPLLEYKGFLSDASDEVIASVEEDLQRCHDAYQWVRAIKVKRETKSSVYAKFRECPEVYVNDMVERIKNEMKDQGVE